LSISFRGGPEPVTLYGCDEEEPISPWLSMPVIFEPPRKITRTSPDAVFHTTDKSESATVPLLPNPPNSQRLALVEAIVPDLSPLREDTVENQPSTITGNGCSGAAAGSESTPVPEILPSKPVDVFPSAPQYVLHKCDQPPTDTSAFAPNDILRRSTQQHKERFCFLPSASSQYESQEISRTKGYMGPLWSLLNHQGGGTCTSWRADIQTQKHPNPWSGVYSDCQSIFADVDIYFNGSTDGEEGCINASVHQTDIHIRVI
jgi:hypothetical protein